MIFWKTTACFGESKENDSTIPKMYQWQTQSAKRPGLEIELS